MRNWGTRGRSGEFMKRGDWEQNERERKRVQEPHPLCFVLEEGEGGIWRGRFFPFRFINLNFLFLWGVGLALDMF